MCYSWCGLMNEHLRISFDLPLQKGLTRENQVRQAHISCVHLKKMTFLLSIHVGVSCCEFLVYHIAMLININCCRSHIFTRVSFLAYSMPKVKEKSTKSMGLQLPFCFENIILFWEFLDIFCCFYYISVAFCVSDRSFKNLNIYLHK